MKYQLKTTQGTQELTLGRIIHTGALLVILILSNEASIANCEAKEFDWSDLGVSLANAKATSLGGNASNLRILVSPQRRKSYDFEYTNGSQPSSGSSDPTSGGSYVVASSSPYLGQSVYQLSSGGSAGNHSSHSSAYSALSASLATLKNRLNARGVTLTSTLGGSGDSTSAGNGAYLHQQQQQQQAQQFDPSQQQAQQAQAQAQQQQQQQQQSQPTYLSVSSQQDSVAPSLGAYTVPPSQGNESNKTIVLAIPAKINFLTGGGGSSSSSSKQHSSLQQQQQQQQQQAQHSQLQQAQQLSLLQSSGVLHGQEQGAPTIEQGQQLGVAGEPQEQQHHQYVIVNQQAQGNSDHHSVAASLSPTQTLTSGQTVYSYQPIQHTGGYATIKQYIPATSGPIAAGQPQLQKVYSLVESPAAVPQQQQVVAAVPVQPQQATQYETQLVDQSVLSTSRYTTCLDTCNSSDPRWRKYTVSKYKACCSRSSQFDNSFLVPEQPSVEKVGEQSSRYSEDAYYNYLYRKSQRARRARRHRPSSSRYNRYSSGGGSPASAAGGPEEDSALDSQGQAANSDPQGGRSSSRGAADSYSAKPYYKSLSSARAYALSGAPDGGAQVAADRETARGEERAEPLAKYHERLSKAERLHRRARARDFDAQLDSPPARGGERESNLAPLADTVEDESVYPREPAGARQSSAQPTGSGYGSGEFSVDLQGRGYGSSSSAGLDAARDEDEAAAGRFDEPSELDAGPGKGDDYYSGEVGPSSSGGGSDLPPSSADSGDTETEAATSSSVYNSRYSTGGGVASARRARKPGKARRAKQQKASSSSASSYYKKSRKQPKSKQPLEPLNGTDYESAQPGSSGGGSDSSYYNQQEQTGGSGSGHQQDQESDQASYPQNKESSGYESSEADKEAVLAKYRQSINETAVANLSKTTMHLKEILSILEKKATQQTLASGSGGGSSQKYNESSAASLPVTSTPAPVTTTTTSLYPSLSSLFGANSPYSSSLSSADFLASAADFAPSSLKSPYRFGDPSSPFSSGSLSPSSFSFGGPSSSSASFGSDTFGLPSPPLPPAPYPQYATFAHANKHSMGGVGSSPGLGSSVGGLHVQKKRRPSKSSRYNDLVLQKAAAHGLVSPSSLALHAKNRLLNPTYYSAFQYPYLSYRGVMGQTSGSSITNPYPYKSHAHKNPYSSLLGVGGVGGGSVSSKLAAAAAASTGAGLYSDESRLHGLSSLTDPLANMGSSLRPSAAMRLRNKPFIFQPQVLPIYTRHSILTSPLDVAAAAGAKAAA